MIPDRIGRTGAVTPPGRPVQDMQQPAFGPPRLAAGTVVWTADGAIPVEYLTPGDRIVTRSSGYATLIEAASLTAVLPLVRIAAHGLGRQRPDCPVTLPADQAILLRGPLAQDLAGRSMAIRPAAALVASGRAEVLGTRACALVSLQLERGDILYASGLEIAAALITA